MFARAPFHVKIQLVRWRIYYEVRRLWRKTWRNCAACARRCAQYGQQKTSTAQTPAQTPAPLDDSDNQKPKKKRKALGPPTMPAT